MGFSGSAAEALGVSAALCSAWVESAVDAGRAAVHQGCERAWQRLRTSHHRVALAADFAAGSEGSGSWEHLEKRWALQVPASILYCGLQA